MLRFESIEPPTLELLKSVQALPAFAKTRLVGGTALALQLGHRVSVDLDLFGSWPSEADLSAELRKAGRVRKTSGTSDGRMQFFFVNGIKVDCVTYDMFPWLEDAREEEGVRLAGMAELSLAVRSLVYFADAEKEPMPRMLIPFDWEAEKERIQEAVRQMF